MLDAQSRKYETRPTVAPGQRYTCAHTTKLVVGFMPNPLLFCRSPPLPSPNLPVNCGPTMIEKHMRRTHKSASFASYVTRNMLVIKRGRAGRWCITQRILSLSAQFAHLGSPRDSKSLPMKRLLKRPLAKRGFTIHELSPRCIGSKPISPTLYLVIPATAGIHPARRSPPSRE